MKLCVSTKLFVQTGRKSLLRRASKGNVKVMQVVEAVIAGLVYGHWSVTVQK